MSSQAAALTGFKVYKWNEKFPYNNVPAHQGLLVVRRAQDKLVRRVLPFTLDDLVMHQSDGDGYFAPHLEGRTFFMALANSLLFEQHVVTELDREINLFLLSCFRFEEYTICCYPSPRLVFVADISYVEAGRSGYALIEDNVGDSNTDETDQIIGELREFCNVNNTFPIEPLSPDEPLGLLEEEKNLDIAVFKGSEEPYECSICLDPLAVDQVVLRTGCGHVYHKRCSLPWFSLEFKCPMCRSSTISTL